MLLTNNNTTSIHGNQNSDENAFKRIKNDKKQQQKQKQKVVKFMPKSLHKYFVD